MLIKGARDIKLHVSVKILRAIQNLRRYKAAVGGNTFLRSSAVLYERQEIKEER